jgi:hypothetical protein
MTIPEANHMAKSRQKAMPHQRWMVERAFMAEP